MVQGFGFRVGPGRYKGFVQSAFSVLNFVSDPAGIRGKDDAVEET